MTPYEDQMINDNFIYVPGESIINPIFLNIAHITSIRIYKDYFDVWTTRGPKRSFFIDKLKYFSKIVGSDKVLMESVQCNNE